MIDVMFLNILEKKVFPNNRPGAGRATQASVRIDCKQCRKRRQTTMKSFEKHWSQVGSIIKFSLRDTGGGHIVFLKSHLFTSRRHRVIWVAVYYV